MIKVSTESPTTCGAEGMNSLNVSPQLLTAAHGPVVLVEGCLHQRGHHAPHRRLIAAPIPLTIVFHAQPASKTNK